jgi:hypothetical protein
MWNIGSWWATRFRSCRNFSNCWLNTARFGAFAGANAFNVPTTWAILLASKFWSVLVATGAGVVFEASLDQALRKI